MSWASSRRAQGGNRFLGRLASWVIAGSALLLVASCGGGQEESIADRVPPASAQRIAAADPTDPAVLIQQDLHALRYIASYADLIQALGADPAASRAHYTAAGRAEGRTISFDATAYLASHADLLRAFGADTTAATRHFIVYGWREGRTISFDALRYVASYADLVRAYGLDAAGATQHYVAYGFAEGRTSTFDALRYEASYPDLIEAFGLDPTAATRHYIASGFAEGRTSSFDALRYEASYADLIVAFGLDPAAATRHFVGSGYREGRRTTFDPAWYVAGYPDLQAAFGSDGDAATRHFIQYGYAEGRLPDSRPPSPPAAPVLTLAFRPVKVFRFGWTDVPGATEYRLLEDPTSTSGYYPVATIAPGAGSHDLVVALYRRVGARYILRACNAAGCADSAAASVTARLLDDAVGYVKASSTGALDYFGTSVAVSADGNTLAVGASGESGSGAVYVFTRSGTTWSQQAYLKASNAGAGDEFGRSVALSADGHTLAVGAPREASSATGINGNERDNSTSVSGAVYVFTRTGTAWSQQAYVKASNAGAWDAFGHAVALSADGNTLAASAPWEASSATGINGNQADDSADYSGAVYVFMRSGATWSQQAYVKASNSDAYDYFGEALALSADGHSTLAVGASFEWSSATGINGNQGDNSASCSGAVYVFTRSGTSWSQQAYVKASNTGANDYFGRSVALSADGNTLAVGAIYEDSSATGINGNQGDNSASGSGAVYVFTRSGTIWSQQAYVKASNTGAGDLFGASVALSADGNTLAVGASGEDSSATGINGNQGSNTAGQSGAVYLY